MCHKESFDLAMLSRGGLVVPITSGSDTMTWATSRDQERVVNVRNSWKLRRFLRFSSRTCKYLR